MGLDIQAGLYCFSRVVKTELGSKKQIPFFLHIQEPTTRYSQSNSWLTENQMLVQCGTKAQTGVPTANQLQSHSSTSRALPLTGRAVGSITKRKTKQF